MSKAYDVIVVGARCAGSPTGMLLARNGYDVLLVDRATFPSDMMSTHLIHPPGVAALKRWGVLEQLRATGCPPMTTYAYDMGPIVITGSPRPAEGVPEAFCPRRTVLDELLVRAAAAAGAELREGFTVDEILVEDGVVTGVRGHETRGGTVTERARVVVGADGRNSLVAKAVGAKCCNAVPAQEATYYAYWSGLTVAIGIRCIDEACVATASGTVRVPGTGRRRARSYQLRAVTAAVATGGPATARLALPASMRRAIRRALTLGREIVVRVRVEVADRAGNTRRLARQIPLRL
jgi:2-polyprenyl-6-methoxyphenol hydroxylase-like FAD-dependent oxidoreductase